MLKFPSCSTSGAKTVVVQNGISSSESKVCVCYHELTSVDTLQSR